MMNRYIASVGDKAKIHSVAEQIRGTGAEVHLVLEGLGVLGFSASPEVLAKIKQIRGVEGVEDDRQYQI